MKWCSWITVCRCEYVLQCELNNRYEIQSTLNNWLILDILYGEELSLDYSENSFMRKYYIEGFEEY